MVVRWRAFERFPQIPAEGVDRRAVSAARLGSTARAVAADALIVEAARCEGLTPRLDHATRLPNTFHAHRLIALAAKEGVQDAVVEALFHAYFHEGHDIGMRSTLLDVASTAGLERAHAARWLDSTDGMAEVWADQARARNLNVRRRAVRAPQRRTRPDLALGPLGVRRRLAARGRANSARTRSG